MNIFALSRDPIEAAQLHVDRHVVKMVTESAQLLCTALRECGADSDTLYRSTHRNHPCAVWARATSGNYLWLLSLLDALLHEYDHRYGRPGKFLRVRAMMRELFTGVELVPPGPLQDFAQAMPDEFRGPDAVAAYRRYYAAGKSHLHSWTKRPIPAFASALA